MDRSQQRRFAGIVAAKHDVYVGQLDLAAVLKAFQLDRRTVLIFIIKASFGVQVTVCTQLGVRQGYSELRERSK
jgi:hypothetical protein